MMYVSKQLRTIMPWGILLMVSCLPPGAGPDAIAPLASQEENTIAMTFHAIPDKSVIYLFRPRSLPYLRALVLVDNREIGFTISKTYMRIELNPGAHEVVSKLEYGGNRSKVFQSKPNAESEFALRTEPGKIYFIQQSPDPLSWNGKLDLHLVPESDGRHEITHGRYCLLASLQELKK